MFSGLTNQVSSWMGAAKGEPQDEEVPTPTKDAEASGDTEKHSPTKGGSKLDLINNVKSQMTGWLGSGIPIPGLRKTETVAPDTAEPAPTEPDTTDPKAEAKDDDDNSRYNSATGGADSRPASAGGTPTEEQPAGVGNGEINYNST
ncbi:Synapse-associated protein of 47 kDa [Eumeta japonica]|uniref:Synapse-associated protein of 47 kDa n=1 Tax=Eumeta variegata TaxID=151549 RepID=A0A4C1Y8D7_EUMVA|nr:Synapse-associated protein of 47 kDa [Eumeta japonica]